MATAAAATAAASAAVMAEAQQEWAAVRAVHAEGKVEVVALGVAMVVEPAWVALAEALAERAGRAAQVAATVARELAAASRPALGSIGRRRRSSAHHGQR